MEIQKDYADLCSLLTGYSVDYLVIGGFAVAWHGAPRFTGDIDIFVRPDPSHIDRMLKAVRKFGFPAEDVSPG